jgi:hypothetical protein
MLSCLYSCRHRMLIVHQTRREHDAGRTLEILSRLVKKSILGGTRSQNTAWAWSVGSRIAEDAIALRAIGTVQQSCPKAISWACPPPTRASMPKPDPLISTCPRLSSSKPSTVESSGSSGCRHSLRPAVSGATCTDYSHGYGSGSAVRLRRPAHGASASTTMLQFHKMVRHHGHNPHPPS